ncbi:MAG: IPT/TIG domain-containing protein [Armatimonadetes bacterium]|nr:IPT/TIG domain-containing protein [Armatimonadota bacterium]
MKGFSVVSFGALTICLLACGGLGSDHAAPTLDGFDPAIASAGQQVAIYGHNFATDGSMEFSIAGTSWAIDSVTPTKILVTVPANVNLDGAVGVADQYGSDLSVDHFVTGTPAAVAEVEPNDAGAGAFYANATSIDGNREITGSLSSITDVDNFVVSALVKGHRYRVHVEPAVASSISISESRTSPNAQTYTLDSNGDAFFTPGVNDVILGLTGGTGNYTVFLELQN